MASDENTLTGVNEMDRFYAAYDATQIDTVINLLQDAHDKCGDPYIRETLYVAKVYLSGMRGELRHVLQHFQEDEWFIDRTSKPQDMEQSE